MTLNRADTAALMRELAGRQIPAKALTRKYAITPEELRAFVEEHREGLELLREELDNPPAAEEILAVSTEPKHLWIKDKTERLARLQDVAEKLAEMIEAGSMDSTVLREYRTYLQDAAEELGQIPNRGASMEEEGKSAVFRIEGVDMEKLS